MEQENQEQKKAEQRQRFNWLKAAIVLNPIIFTVAIIIYFILSATFTKSANKDIPNQINVLLILFGLVVSVWVGLNIYNIVTKDEIEKLQRQTEEKVEIVQTKINGLSDEMNTQINLLKETTAEMDSLKNKYLKSGDLFLTHVRNMFFIQLLSLSASYYASTDILIENIKEIVNNKNLSNPNTQTAYYNDLIEIETFFFAASQANRTQSTNDRITFSKKGLNICNEFFKTYESFLQQNGQNEIIYGYIYLRIGDFNYYIGKRNDSEKLQNAVENYKNALNCLLPARLFFVDENNIQSLRLDHTASISQLKCISYISNIVGECNNLLYDININSNAPFKHEMAVQNMQDAIRYFNYMKCAHKFMLLKNEKTPIYFATYYRNSTTIHDKETSGDYTKDENIIQSYQECIKINEHDSLSYRNIAMRRLKNISEKIETATSVSDKNYIYSNALKTASYIQLYILHASSKIEGYNMLGWAYTLAGAASLSADVALKYFNMAKEALDLANAANAGSDNKSTTFNRTRLAKYSESVCPFPQ